jgi:hypothetical protein
MSTDIDIFIDSTCTLEELKLLIEKAFRINFLEEKEEGYNYGYYSLGIILKLYKDHGFEDDLGIEFSKYPYALSIDVDTRARDYGCRINLQYYASLYVYNVISKELNLVSVMNFSPEGAEF